MIMGFWKDVAYDMQRGMSRDKAIELNAKLRSDKYSLEEKRKIEAMAEADLVIDKMK